MKFYSRYKGYKVWLRPSYYRMTTTGDRVFVQGVFAKFNNGWFETEDQEIISLLKSAKTYGIDFWSVDEPSQPNPQGLAEEKIKEQTKEEVVTDCPKCGKTFKNKAGVLAHIRFYHKDETP